MAEFNIPPTRDARSFAECTSLMLDQVRNIVRTTSEHLDIDYASARLFPYEALQSKQARVFGCSPDFDAYKDGDAHLPVRPSELETSDGAWRYAGGHIHLGYEADVPPHVVAQLCDVFLGLPSIGLDKQDGRRGLYGQAGRFRPTAYGMEYRTLSNFWIFDSNLAYDLGHRALRIGAMIEGQVGMVQKVYHEIPWLDVQAAINEENEELAADLLAYVTNDLNLQGAA